MIKTRTLSNGIKVVLEDIEYVESAAFGIWARVGAVDEEQSIAGVSHFIEHMMFKGTDKRNAAQIAGDADKIGAQMNAFTGKEATCYYIKALSETLEEAMDIVLDMFVNSQFATVEMNRERNVIKEELKMISDTPDDVAHDLISELVFKGNPLGHSIIGTNTTLNNITRNKILDYRKAKYTADTVVVAIAGKFNEERVMEILENALCGFAGKKEEPIYPDSYAEPQFKLKVKDIEQSHICLACPTVSRKDSKRLPLIILSDIMGGNMSSRFFQNIREEKGLAYSVFSTNTAYMKGGFFNIYAGVAHDKIAATIDAISDELDILKKDGVTKAELEKAKTQLKAAMIFNNEKVASRMFSVGRMLALDGEIEMLDQLLKKIDAVTMADIECVSEMIYNINNYSCAVVSNHRLPIKKYIQG